MTDPRQNDKPLPQSTLGMLVHYEICAAWWPQFISWGPLQNLIATYFAHKVLRKYRRWVWCLKRIERMKEANK